MRRILLIISLICLALASFSQNNNKNVNVRIGSERIGDSIFYKKITKTRIGDQVKVDQEILSSSKVKQEELNNTKQNSNSAQVNQTIQSNTNKNLQAFIIGINIDFTTLNNNQRLNSLLGMKGINNLNLGGDISLGGRFGNGIEFKVSYGVESIINKTSNKTLKSISNIGTLTFGYPFILKNDEYMIVPYTGLGYNLTNLQYSRTYSRAISFEELKESSWAVLSHNLYIPLGVEFRYRLLPISYLSFGLEYRLNVFNTGALLPNTLQRVDNFPKFTINNLAIKIGLTGIFNKN